MTILLVEDDAASRNATRELLEMTGYAVAAVWSRASALDWCRRHGEAPSLVVCDYLLPDPAYGIDVIGEIRDVYAEVVPAILVTGLLDAEIAAEAQRRRCMLLRKPVSSSDLLDAIDALVAGPDRAAG